MDLIKREQAKEAGGHDATTNDAPAWPRPTWRGHELRTQAAKESGNMSI